MSPLRVAKPSLSEIDQIAARRLQDSPYYFLKSVRCDFEAGVLTLRGSVPNRQLKALAEVIVSRVEGVQEVANRIEVRDPMLMPSAPAARSAG